MTTATMTIPSDMQLQRNVQDELRWQPSVDAAEIGVAVKDGVVTLTGNVKNFFQKWEAEAAAVRVRGVRALANEIEVRLPGDFRRNDTDIARAATEALAWNASVPPDRVKVTVSDAWIALRGELDWQYQKFAAETAVRYLVGVRGVTNEISVKPTVTPSEVKARIEDAFRRSAALDARRIRVETEGGRVTLSGEVSSWAERDQARQSAWAAPGVSLVDDRLTVTPEIA